MSQPAVKTALITGGNSGIGKDIARQLALRSTTTRIYLACRSEERARSAVKDLEVRTGRAIFQIVIMDVEDGDSVRAAVTEVDGSIDVLFMNAGGSGGRIPLELTKSGVTQIFAQNVLGHVVLLEELVKANKLKHVAILAGSEAAVGVPKLGIKRPVFKTSSADEFASMCDGTFFRNSKFDSPLAYAQVKYIGALWMASFARQNPGLKFVTISPGNTQGTEIASGLPLLVRLLVKYIAMPIIMPLFGLSHKLEIGAARLVDAVDDEALRSGSFYASKENALTGDVVDQGTFCPDLKNERIQDNANEAIHRFL